MTPLKSSAVFYTKREIVIFMVCFHLIFSFKQSQFVVSGLAWEYGRPQVFLTALWPDLCPAPVMQLWGEGTLPVPLGGPEQEPACDSRELLI